MREMSCPVTSVDRSARRWLARLLCLAFFSAFCLPAQAEDLVDFDIPAQPLASALVAFAVQARLSLGQTGVDLRPYRAPALKGRYAPREALRLLLSATRFRFQFLDATTVRILPPPPPPRDDVKSRPQKARLDDDSAIPNIIVTASKRAARAQSLPVSLGSVDGEQLRAFGITDMNGLAPRLAGVLVTNLGPGRNKIFVRGLSDGTFVDRSQSTVGIYWDETPITFSEANPDLRLVDIERVEVARGPQGTLYGSGAIGGTYRVVTRKPDLEAISASISASGALIEDGGVTSAAEAVFNLPVIEDRLGVRFVGYFNRQAGYIDDLRLGLNDVNSAEIYGGRAAMRLKPASRWTVDVALNYQDIELADTQYFLEPLGPFKRANFLPEPYRDRFRHANVTLSAAFDWAELVSASAYVDRNITSQADATLIVPRLTGLALTPSPFTSDNAIRTFSHETRLVSVRPGRLDWLAGAFLFGRNENLATNIMVPGAGEAFAGRGFPSDRIFWESRDDRVRQMAVFGEATYALAPAWRLTAGLRLFRTTFDTASLSDGIANEGTSLIKGENNETGLTPKLVLGYQPSTSFLYFAQVSQGFRVGGININTPLDALLTSDPREAKDELNRFESDKLWNFELGMKSTWAGGLLLVNASVFYVIWRDIQTDQLLPSGLTYVAKAGNARSIGLELEVTARPLDNLDISATFFRSDPQLTAGNAFLGAEKGDRLPGVTGLSAGLSLAYRFDLPFRLEGLLAGDYSYVGESSLTFNEEGSPAMGRYHSGNLRLEIGRDAWRAGLFARNAGNQRANTFAFGNPFSLAAGTQVTPLRPRAIGAFLRFEY
ncbi:MAG: TonB-dependent receptor [Pseudomonadota bacterium]